MNKSVLLLLLFLGILFIATEIIRSKHKCEASRIIYRYVPRTPMDEYNEPVPVSEIFKTMFSRPSPWVNSLAATDDRKKEEINKYFISQS